MNGPADTEDVCSIVLAQVVANDGPGVVAVAAGFSACVDGAADVVVSPVVLDDGSDGAIVDIDRTVLVIAGVNAGL